MDRLDENLYNKLNKIRDELDSYMDIKLYIKRMHALN